MKSQVTIKHDRTNDTYNVRIRYDDEGFQDEVVLKYKLVGGIATFVKDTSNSGVELNVETPLSAYQLLHLMCTGGC